jgi:HSP20 family protein
MNTVVKNFNTLNGLPALFNELFNEVNLGNTQLNKNLPAANILEESEKFKVVLAAPGLKKEDFKIEVHERNLKISAEIEVAEVNQEEEPKTQKYISKEFSVGAFTRVFKLPNTIETDNIEATYDDGILTISLPKKEEAKPKEPRFVSIN